MFKQGFSHVSKLVSRALAHITLAVMLLCVSTPAVQADTPRTYTVMTYNLYQGTELQNTLAATTSTELVFGIAADYNNVIATNYPERAAALASEIAQDKPLLVGLQEVTLWRTAYPCDPNHPTIPTTVSYDFLRITSWRVDRSPRWMYTWLARNPLRARRLASGPRTMLAWSRRCRLGRKRQGVA